MSISQINLSSDVYSRSLIINNRAVAGGKVVNTINDEAKGVKDGTPIPPEEVCNYDCAVAYPMNYYSTQFSVYDNNPTGYHVNIYNDTNTSRYMVSALRSSPGGYSKYYYDLSTCDLSRVTGGNSPNPPSWTYYINPSNWANQSDETNYLNAYSEMMTILNIVLNGTAPSAGNPEIQANVDYLNCVPGLYTSVVDETINNLKNVKIFPNPCGLNADVKGVNISFNVANKTAVSVNVYDITGKLVTKIADKEEKEAGDQQMLWDIKGISSGMYFCIIEVGKMVIREKVIVTK